MSGRGGGEVAGVGGKRRTLGRWREWRGEGKYREGMRGGMRGRFSGKWRSGGGRGGRGGGWEVGGVWERD